MIKKIRNDGIFKKPEIQKIEKQKKILSKDRKKNYKKFYIFSLASVILIFLVLAIFLVSGFLKIASLLVFFTIIESLRL